MNKAEVIARISQQTGIAPDTCQHIVKAFENQSGDSLINRFKGVRDSHEDVVAGVAEKSGCPAEDCEKVIRALDEVLDAGLSAKLRFFRK